MAKVREAALDDLHPTQLTVGLIVVADKKRHLAALNTDERRDFLQSHPMPAVLGPKGALYITDHHHLGRAAIEAGLATAYFLVEDDLTACKPREFWKEMNKNQWVHPLDENGVRHYYEVIPSKLDKLVDDLYRSVAGYVRDAGGYEKTPTAFAEFVWADFFRRNIPVEQVRSDFQGAVRDGVALAGSRLARGIPGYRG